MKLLNLKHTRVHYTYGRKDATRYIFVQIYPTHLLKLVEPLTDLYFYPFAERLIPAVTGSLLKVLRDEA